MLPPTAITSLDSDGFWRASRPPGTSPLLVFLNSKSGDSQVNLLQVPVALLAGQRTRDLEVAGSSPAWAPLRIVAFDKLLTPALCLRHQAV